MFGRFAIKPRAKHWKHQVCVCVRIIIIGVCVCVCVQRVYVCIDILGLRSNAIRDLGTQFFRPLCAARRSRGRLWSGRPTRDQYESGRSCSPYPAGLVVFTRLRLSGTAFVVLLSAARRRVRRPVMFARRRLCKRYRITKSIYTP